MCVMWPQQSNIIRYTGLDGWVIVLFGTVKSGLHSTQPAPHCAQTQQTELHIHCVSEWLLDWAQQPKCSTATKTKSLQMQKLSVTKSNMFPLLAQWCSFTQLPIPHKCNINTTSKVIKDGFKKWNIKYNKDKLEIWGRAQRKAARRRKSDCRDNFGWFKCRSQQCHLANQSGKSSEIAPKFHLGGSTFAPITFFVCGPKFTNFFRPMWERLFPLGVHASKPWSISSTCKNLRDQHPLRAKI